MPPRAAASSNNAPGGNITEYLMHADTVISGWTAVMATSARAFSEDVSALNDLSVLAFQEA